MEAVDLEGSSPCNWFILMGLELYINLLLINDKIWNSNINQLTLSMGCGGSIIGFFDRCYIYLLFVKGRCIHGALQFCMQNWAFVKHSVMFNEFQQQQFQFQTCIKYQNSNIGGLSPWVLVMLALFAEGFKFKFKFGYWLTLSLSVSCGGLATKIWTTTLLAWYG